MKKIETAIWIEIHRIEAATGERLTWYGKDEQIVESDSHHFARATTSRSLLAQLRQSAIHED